MASYNPLERTLARALDAVPTARSTARQAYQRANYLFHAERGFCYALHPSVSMHTPAEWAGFHHHPQAQFFGYYDKSPWSPDMRWYTCHRLTHALVDIQVYDQRTRSSLIVGRSTAWNYQQGCMVQWLPRQSTPTLIYNTVVNGHLGACVVPVPSGSPHILPAPIQIIHPHGQYALLLNYRRLAICDPAYGYTPLVENFAPDLPLDQDGIWQIDLVGGQPQLLISLAQLEQIQPRPELAQSHHPHVNHLLYSPAGNRFVFLHRWRAAKGRFSRLYVADRTHATPRLLLDARMVSHYGWRDERTILAYARTTAHGDGYYLIDVEQGNSTPLARGTLERLGDGHPTYSPDRQWIVTDSYPDRARQRHLLLYHVPTGELIEVGRFLAPLRYDGDLRCDLHPRWSPDGRMLSIDSTHSGTRQTYILDVSALVQS